MTVSWSRHQYVEFVFDQKLPTWLLLHRHAFEWLGGVPERVVLDNLKAAVVKACFDDPLIQQAYRECAEHYGFLIAPCRPRTPRHKGKVEQGGVHYVKRNFLAGRAPTSITQANQDVRVWCNTTAGLRIHGTTNEQPLVRFQETERAQLKPLPKTPYDLAVWKQVTVGADGYITFDNAYYSIPCRYTKGTRLLVRGGAQFVTIFTQEHQPVTTHDRARQPGERMTHPDHLPADKVPGLMVSREGCQAAAQDIGPATSQTVAELLDDRVVDRLRTAGRLLRLRERYGDERLEAACGRAQQFAEPTYATVKRILINGLEQKQLLQRQCRRLDLFAPSPERPATCWDTCLEVWHGTDTPAHAVPDQIASVGNSANPGCTQSPGRGRPMVLCRVLVASARRRGGAPGSETTDAAPAAFDGHQHQDHRDLRFQFQSGAQPPTRSATGQL